MSRSQHYTGFLSSADQSSHNTNSHTNKNIKQENTIAAVRCWPQGRTEDELVDCIMPGRWWTVILPGLEDCRTDRGPRLKTRISGSDWSDPLPPRSSFIEAVNYTLASLTVLANGFVKTWFQIMALLRHTARKPYCHHKFYTIIYKKKHHH